GRCAFCEEPISFQYPFVELLSGLSAVLAYTQNDLPVAIVLYVFACCLIVISFIDIKYYIIPDVITYPGMLIAVLFAIGNHYYHFFGEPIVTSIYQAFWGLVLGGGFLLFISEVYFRLRKKVGLGFGDIKLMTMVGVLFGPACAYYTIFIGSFCGSIIGVTLILLARGQMARPLPFGPYLALGAYLYLFAPIDWQRLMGI
ncbi:MAG: prepilin peptidase, partial [Bdellovibrionales bacterium]|nr:prepilin peptidase [Bdellovibrionales bacterium]